MPSGQDHKPLENRLLVFWTFKRHGTQDRLGKMIREVGEIKHWLMLLLVRSGSPKWSQYVRQGKKIDRSHTAEFLLHFSSLYKQITLSLMIKYPKRIFSWISLQNRRCFQTVGLMLGVAAPLRESILKDKAGGFLHYSFFSKIKCRAREERSWPM